MSDVNQMFPPPHEFPAPSLDFRFSEFYLPPEDNHEFARQWSLAIHTAPHTVKFYCITDAGLPCSSAGSHAL